MITRGSQPRTALAMSALRDIVGQSERSGAKRCVAVLYLDRLSQALAKPHHRRLARQALQGLTSADRAQMFDLPFGRTAIVWRDHGGTEIDIARRSLEHLLSDQSELSSANSVELLSSYDLPQQAARLLDDLAETAPAQCGGERIAIDLKLLAALEATLAQADLAGFARIRSVMALQDAVYLDATAIPVWKERYFAIDDLARNLSPGRDLRADPWLFKRLTRTLDMRMLSLLSAPGALARSGPFAINVNVRTILSPEFLRFDGVLPNQLRGEVTLTLRAADVFADNADFAFARNFARTRSYRLALAEVTPPLLSILNVATAGIDLLHVGLTPELRAADVAWRNRVPPGSSIVITSIDRPSDLRWAVMQGFRLGCGALLSR